MQLSNEEIKKYLKDVLELEKNKYEIMRIMEELNNERSFHVDKPMPSNTSEGVGGVLFFLLLTIPLGALIGGFLGAMISSIKNEFPFWQLVKIFAILGAVLPVIIGVFMKYSDRNSYKKKCAEIKSGNENAADLVYKQNSIINESEEKLKLAYHETDTDLERMYSVNIIYPKYRNFVAMSSIYEYFDSGRCTTLADAYNLYETEVRMDRIIERLDIIITKLDEIKQNQYYMYHAIKSLQPKIEKLTSSVKNCAAHLNRIEANTAVTAYTTEIIEKNQFYMRNFTNSFHV